MPIKEVATILPYSGEKVLLQLRDFNPRIVYPGCWGFFGGTVEFGETPLQSAKRELSEEIGHIPKEMYALSKDSVSAPNEVMMYSLLCAVGNSTDRNHSEGRNGFRLFHPSGNTFKATLFK